MRNTPEGPSLTDYIGMYGGCGIGIILVLWGAWEAAFLMIGFASGVWVGGFANDVRRYRREQ